MGKRPIRNRNVIGFSWATSNKRAGVRIGRNLVSYRVPFDFFHPSNTFLLIITVIVHPSNLNAIFPNEFNGIWHVVDPCMQTLLAMAMSLQKLIDTKLVWINSLSENSPEDDQNIQWKNNEHHAEHNVNALKKIPTEDYSNACVLGTNVAHCQHNFSMGSASSHRLGGLSTAVVCISGRQIEESEIMIEVRRAECSPSLTKTYGNM